MKDKIFKFLKWFKGEILNKDMLIWFVIAEVIFWTPCIIGVVLAITLDPWFWGICTVYIGFWLAPLTPAVPLQLGLAFGLKKLAQFIKSKRSTTDY